MGEGGQSAASRAAAASHAAASGFNPVFSIAKNKADPVLILGGIALIGVLYLIGKSI